MAESSDRSQIFWPVFVTVAALSSATVWRFAPELGRHLPDSVRTSICALFGRTATVSAPAAETSSADDAAPQDQTEPDARTTARDASAAVPQPKATSVADARKPALPREPQSSAAVSPYLEPAAKALREFRQLNADFERRQNGMSLAEQRAVMKKLHALNQRVESLNRKHREWKQAHPQAAGSSSR